MLAGELRCSALVEAYLQRIDAFDRAGPKLNTIVSLSDQAQRRAAELDAELAAPPAGRPLPVTDLLLDGLALAIAEGPTGGRAAGEAGDKRVLPAGGPGAEGTAMAAFRVQH